MLLKLNNEYVGIKSTATRDMNLGSKVNYLGCDLKANDQNGVR